MKKTYFMRTYKINKSTSIATFFALVFQIVVNLIILVLRRSIESEHLVKILSFILKGVDTIANISRNVVISCIIILFVLIIPELIGRIKRDSIKNWVIAIRVTKRIHQYLAFSDLENEEALKRYNKCIRSAVIDVREKQINFILKLPNDRAIQQLILSIKDPLRGEIVNQFPEYALSNFTREKDYLKLEGTK